MSGSLDSDQVECWRPHRFAGGYLPQVALAEIHEFDCSTKAPEWLLKRR